MHFLSSVIQYKDYYFLDHNYGIIRCRRTQRNKKLKEMP